MKNNCQHIQLALLEGSTDYNAHLDGCSECQDFVAMLEMSSGATFEAYEPTAVLDQTVLGYAKQRQVKVGGAPLQFVAILLAAAAAVMIGAYVLMQGASVGEVGDPSPIAQGGEERAPTGGVVQAFAVDEALSGLLQDVADADYSGEHIDDDILNMELQLAMLQTESF